MNKTGEIVFNDDGSVKEINGYNGNRKNFEYIELSEYYEIVERMEKETSKLAIALNEVQYLLRKLG